ncbi:MULTISPECIES: DNA gyrase inhibitor YacG [Pseudoalteromonas]|uniref:DNA gyrase inhibitor YacG n=2 Tax=Pseudoalteromonas TaxID=53246 RepID=A0A4Q7EE35_9GAMM|nr:MULTISPECIES: DNA gyrase inhibitor YacG [Pseudoalteromonas]QTL36056.1 DNA gyrase inhibitor YacG [Pseudoalteromonas viridis]RZM81267.1 DNA gyrase inhibitor YacG [Pseudoalteromonas rubra]
MPVSVKCPTCQAAVVWSAQSPHRPFCSKRCQLIDLGEWSEENNKISTPLNSADLSPEAARDMVEDLEAMLAKNDDNFFKE